MIDPVVVQIDPPKTPFRLPKLPKMGERVSKIIISSAAVVICLTMVSFVVYSFITNSKSFKTAHHLTPTAVVNTAVQPSAAALPGGTTAYGTGGGTGENNPVVTLSALPSSVLLGKKTHLTWSVTNNPTSCTASDDWSGSKPASGEEDTPALTKQQTYLFTITCKNATGTGYSTVSIGTISQSTTGSSSGSSTASAGAKPTVTISAYPAAIYTGDTSTISWSSTSGATSCTASGDWTGAKAASGSEKTAVLNAARSYTYTVSCVNAAGSGQATTSLLVREPLPNVPNVVISSNALGSVQPGSSVIITWDVANNPTTCTATGDWSGSRPASGSQTVGPLNTIKVYNYTLTCSNAAGSQSDIIPISVLPSPPVVSLTASPSTINTGSSSTISWSSTNSPTSCTAGGSWSGSKSNSGTSSTGVITTVRTNTYTLTCSNAGGTSATATTTLRVVAPPPPPAPVVSLSVSPISINTGSSATITWSGTNSPTSCTASGDWSGTKAVSGSSSTGTLSTARTYTYTLTCSNAGGSGSASAGLTVSSSGPAVSAPVVTIAASPTSAGTGASSTLSWSVANSPTSCMASGGWTGSKAASGSASTGAFATAGTYTYTLMCSNSAGSGTKSASVSVTATPGITISVSPSTITAGASSTLSWSVTNSPTSCTAGGSWSGSKAASGTQALAPAAGSYTYTLSCTNSGGTTSSSAALTVNPAATVYCSGRTPCIGVSELATHNTAANCWGYNLDWVLDLTSYAPKHKGGTSAGSLATANSTCKSDIHGFLAGTAAIPGFKDSGGSTKHSHNSSTVNNGSGNLLASYFKGYYDPAKP